MASRSSAVHTPEAPTTVVRRERETRPAFVALHALGRGVLAGATVVSALMAIELDFGVPRLFVALLMGFLGFAFVSAGDGLVTLLWTVLRALFTQGRFQRGLETLRAVPPVPIGRVLGAFVYVAGDQLWPQSFLKQVTLPVVGEITIVLMGLTYVAVALARMAGRAFAVRAALFAPPLVLTLGFGLWVGDPGFDDYLVEVAAMAAPAGPAVEDPSAPGPFAVRTLSYGSGTSLRRPEYGRGADLVTTSVDGSEIFAGYGGLTGRYFRWYWGFDFGALPLNGLVWTPEGDGPFPLVLVVHGNHAMSEPSEPGYAYLAEHLASHGYVVAAIDQNFLNGLFFFDGAFAEMPLRAWMILQHLKEWRRWNATPGHPFAGRVDLDRVALVGHSRGGEAVAWAAHLDEHAMAPVSHVSPPSEFGFAIRGVVAIAPSDAYEGPNGRKPSSLGADYLLLAGGHDADSHLLFGQAQYNRIRLEDDGDRFKALAYVHRANHGQFNSEWGDRDRGLYNSLLLNRAPLLSADGQQGVAKTFVTSFLHASLQDRPAYRALFENPATVSDGTEMGHVVTQLQVATSIVVEDFERDDSPVGTAAPRVCVEALLQRDGQREQGNRALRLAWDAGTRTSFETAVTPEVLARWSPAPGDGLTFALAGVPGATAPHEVVVELMADDAASARLSLDSSRLPALPAHLVKATWLYGRPGFPGRMQPEEIVLQTYTVPLRAFAAAHPQFDLDGLRGIRFTFGGDAPGEIYLDEVALARP
jgi:dienelactone hydrolase